MCTIAQTNTEAAKFELSSRMRNLVKQGVKRCGSWYIVKSDTIVPVARFASLYSNLSFQFKHVHYKKKKYYTNENIII